VVFARRQIGGGVLRLWETVRDAVAPPRARVHRRSTPAPRTTAATETAAATATATETATAEPARAATPSERPAATAPRMAVPVEVRRPPRTGPLAAEAQLLGQAIARLHTAEDPQGTLAVLDRYHRRHPHGALSAEADRLQLQALVALGRVDEALALLSTLPAEAVAASPELRLLRAELRAADSCAAALPDFDWVLARSVAAPLAERALYGRAGCRLRVGDRAGAEQDLRAYRQRFPRGRFRADVDRHLDTLADPRPAGP
jgi:hypothetical protein